MRREVEARKDSLTPELTPEKAERLGAQAAAILVATPEFGAAASLALYGALPDELPTLPIFEAARSAGMKCVLPRILAAGELEFAVTLAWGDLLPGRYGVPEPIAGSTVVALAHVELVVVPGLAFDRDGGRLGRGGGYYDRALRKLAAADPARPPVFGLAHEWQLMDDVPRDEFDQPVDAIVTDCRIVRVAGRLRGAEAGSTGR